ncbi:MAG: hypothetical protein M3347_00450, partial [Armatimonadota bacterium]|nr:hypothetical protein [Armatimonadota bacterium]
MSPSKFLLLGTLILLGFWQLEPPVQAQAVGPHKLLVVTHSAGFKHTVVTRKTEDELNLVEQIVEMLGQNSGAFTTSFVYSAEECRQVTPEILNGYDGVFFFT